MKIGIMGGGQLAQMLVLAGVPLGFEFICLEKNKNCPAAKVAPILLSEYDDIAALKQLAEQVDVMTYEFENVSLDALRAIESMAPIYPPINALEISQDRVKEKDFFTHLNIPTTDYHSIDTWEALQIAADKIGLPAVLKTRRMGYDGKGQYVVRNQEELLSAWNALKGQKVLLENYVKFDREISLIAIRGITGETAFYSLVQNQHHEGILAVSLAPYLDLELETLARNYLEKILTELNYVGVLTVEFFQVGNALFANEMAPRVHNSGHWTIEGAYVSQFENHLRAITQRPLGSTEGLGHAGMLNLIGALPNLADLFKIPEAHIHLYGKEARAKRKLGHVTLCMQDENMFLQKFRTLQQLIFAENG